MLLVKPGQSYPGLTFDRCPACADVALDAITQSALYVLARAVPDALGEIAGTIGLSYRLRVRLDDETGQEIASDEVEAQQEVDLDHDANDWELEPLEEDREGPSAEGSASGSQAHASLADFQTMLDRIVLEPAAPHAVSGVVAGRLFGFERLIGTFEVLISPS